MTETGESSFTAYRFERRLTTLPRDPDRPVPDAQAPGDIAAAGSLLRSLNPGGRQDPGRQTPRASAFTGASRVLALQSLAGNSATCHYVTGATAAGPGNVVQRAVKYRKKRAKKVKDLLEYLQTFELGTDEERQILVGDQDALSVVIGIDPKVLDIDVDQTGGVTRLVQAVQKIKSQQAQTKPETGAVTTEGEKKTGGGSETKAAERGMGRCLKSGFAIDVFKGCRKNLLIVAQRLPHKGVLSKLRDELLSLERFTDISANFDAFDTCIRAIVDITCHVLEETTLLEASDSNPPPATSSSTSSSASKKKTKQKAKQKAKSGAGTAFECLMLRSVSDILLPLVCNPDRLVRALSAAALPKIEESTPFPDVVAVGGVFTTLQGTIFTIYALDQHLSAPVDQVEKFLTAEFTVDDIARMLTVPVLVERLQTAAAAEGVQPLKIIKLQEFVDNYQRCTSTERLSFDVGTALLPVCECFDRLDTITKTFVMRFKDEKRRQDFQEVRLTAAQSEDDSAHCHLGFADQMKSILSQVLRALGGGGTGLTRLLAAAAERQTELGLPALSLFMGEPRDVPVLPRPRPKRTKAPFPWQVHGGTWENRAGKPPPKKPNE